MPPRKSKAILKNVPAATTPDTDTPGTSTKKRKVDWATIDEPKPFQGFELKAVKAKTPKKAIQANKKQKTGKPSDGETERYRDAPLGADIVQKNPFPESELSETRYQVQPTAEWESTLRYRKFTISEAEFEVGQVIFVAKTEEAHDTEDAIQHWIGRVLEVRAGDPSHVYLRVYWLYRPEDLPGGREPHHGDSELIASNHMDIIEALTVVDKAEVIHWDEDPDNSDWPLKDQLFWRQTFDIGKPKGQQLSKLRQFCADRAPCNPDEPLVNCPSCSEWLHAHCLENQAVQDAIDEHVPPTKGKKKGGRKSSSDAAFTALLTTNESGQICLTVTDQRPTKKNQSWNVDVNCLLCHELIEKAAKDVPSKPSTQKKITEVAGDVAIRSKEVAKENDEEVDSVVGKDDDDGDQLPTSTTALPADPVEQPTKSARGPGRPPKRKRRTTETTMAEMTPPPTTISETVFQSGMRSVKRLLWRE